MAKQKRKFDPTKARLIRLYQKYTTYEIGQKFGVSAEIVRRRLLEHGIETAPTGPQKFKTPPRNELHDAYQKVSIDGIAKKYGVGYGTVWRWLKDAGISLKGYGNHRQKPRVFSERHLKNLRNSLRKMGQFGSANPNFRDHRTQENLRLRRTGAYIEWRKRALELRGFKCQDCGAKHGSVCGECGHKNMLHVHHVKSFIDFPEQRFRPTNSEVLCPPCHRLRHYGKSGEFGKTLK